MRLSWRLLVFALLLPLLAACGSDVAEETAVSPTTGPALLVFYTDN